MFVAGDRKIAQNGLGPPITLNYIMNVFTVTVLALY